MRYFVSDDHWDIDGYYRQLEALAPRLPKAVVRFFSRDSFHDADFLSFTTRNLAQPGVRRRKDPTDVEIKLRHVCGAHYLLQYSGVVKILVDYDSRKKAFEGLDGCLVPWGPDYRGLDQWAYDELTAVDSTYLSHEFSLHSGATLALSFRRLSIVRFQGEAGK